MTILILPGVGSPVPPTIYQSTSKTYNFSVSQYQVIRQAMLDVGALDGLEHPTNEEYTDCSFKLNMLVKQWMGKQDFAPGMKVWTRERATLFLGYSKYVYNLGVTGDNWCQSTNGLTYPQQYNSALLSAQALAGQANIVIPSVAGWNVGDYIGVLVGSDLQWTTISAINTLTNTITLAVNLTGIASVNAQVFSYTVKAQRPEVIIFANLRDIYFNDTPLRKLTVEEYESLPTKAMPTFQSDPTAYLYESKFTVQAPNGRLYIDCGGAQDVTKVLHVTWLRPVQDFDNPGDCPDYPQRWYQPLVLELGKLIAPMFDCEWTKTLEESRQSALAIAQEGDPEESVAYFEVDSNDAYGP
jgi:hypothetical protein